LRKDALLIAQRVQNKPWKQDYPNTNESAAVFFPSARSPISLQISMFAPSIAEYEAMQN
jgi:hypothetical protein